MEFDLSIIEFDLSIMEFDLSIMEFDLSIPNLCPFIDFITYRKFSKHSDT